MKSRQSRIHVSEGIVLEEGQPALPDGDVLNNMLELLSNQDACLKVAISTAILESQSRMCAEPASDGLARFT